MNKGISFYFGYKMAPQERMKLIKEAGFNCIITSADEKFDNQNGKVKEQIKLVKKYNLKLSSLHMRYDFNELENFFCENKIGDKIEKDIKKDLKVANKYGFKCVVVHAKGKFNEIGKKRFERILKVCEKYDVPIAIENLIDTRLIEEIFENIDNDYLMFCYDSGHNHCFNPSFDCLEKYKDKLICVHLHDNKGEKDEHTLNKYGNIDWDDLAKKLAKCKFVNLDYEVFMNTRGDETPQEVLTEVFNQANELEKMILKYKDL